MRTPLPLPSKIRIGTAGWSIPRAVAADFPGPGPHLDRYARVLHCAEINSSFYRPPRPATWLRWAASVPPGFRFAVKAPKTITHTGLNASAHLLHEFLAGAAHLGPTLGPLLFQLPPKQIFDQTPAETLLTTLRQHFPGPVALEPRHATWFAPEATALLQAFQVARVAADPARVPEAAVPLSSPLLTYFRLHGSPRTYYSPYTPEYLAQLRTDLLPYARQSAEVWVIFDNTASGAAAANALELARSL